MKNRLGFLFGVAALAVLPAAAAPEPSSRVGLSEAQRYAIEHNLDVRALRRDWEAARAKSRRARSVFFPRIGVAGGADGFISKQNNNSGVVGYLSGTYNLFNGFEDTTRADVADYDADKAKVRLDRAAFRIGLEVERLFHLFLFKRAAIELKKESIELNEAQQRSARQRRGSGLSSDSDILEFDLRESLLRSDIFSLEQEVEEARTHLRKLLGEEIGGNIEPMGELQHRHIKSTLKELVDRVPKEGEAILVAKYDLSIANLEARIWRSKWFPRVDIDTKVGYLPYDVRPGPDQIAFGGGIILRLDLFSGFDNLWERRENEAKRLSSEARLKDSLLTAVTEMEIAYRKIRTIQERVDLEAKNEAWANRYYSLVLTEYRRGVKNSADVKLAADGLYEAKLRKKNYQYEFLVQKIELEKLLGGTVDTESIDEGHEDA